MVAVTLITHRDEIPADTRALRHAKCGTEFATDDVENDGADKLLCWKCEDAEAGRGYGFVALRRRTASERAGGQPYGPLPWVFARGEGPALDPLEFRLVVALWGYQGEHNDAHPSLASLAALCGRSERHVGRVLDGLVQRGLLMRWRPASRKAYRWDVGPLIRGEVEERGPDADVRSSTPTAPDDDSAIGTLDPGGPDAHVHKDRTPMSGRDRTPTSGKEELGEEELGEEETLEEEPPPEGRASLDTTNDDFTDEDVKGDVSDIVDEEPLSNAALALQERLRFRAGLRGAAA